MCLGAKGLLHAVPAAERHTHPERVPRTALVAIDAPLLGEWSEVAWLDERLQHLLARGRGWAVGGKSHA